MKPKNSDGDRVLMGMMREWRFVPGSNFLQYKCDHKDTTPWKEMSLKKNRKPHLNEIDWAGLEMPGI